ncbi:MAG: TolC family protein [Planctomycetota bacterium]
MATRSSAKIRANALMATAVSLVLASCQPARFQPRAIDYDMILPGGSGSLDRRYRAGGKLGDGDGSGTEASSANPREGVDGEIARASQEIDESPAYSEKLKLAAVVDSVTSRFPLYLAKLLERDIASGRVEEAMGQFDTKLAGKLGGQLDGFYESTVGQAGLEQPLATGDTIYGGYRISDGFLPDYYKDRTQDDGRLFFGGRFPLLRNRGMDGRRRDVRVAQIDAALAEPEIDAARIGYVQKASQSYHKWTATGRKLQIARQLLDLAEARQAGLQRGVDRQFLAPLVLTDNTRLIAKRRIYVIKAERDFQVAALQLSLFLRDEHDDPIVVSEANLPEAVVAVAPPTADAAGTEAEQAAAAEEAAASAAEAERMLARSLTEDVALAVRQRPDLVALQLEIERIEADRDLAENQMLPNLDLIVDVATPLNSAPYKDREDIELFVGGELKLPLQRRKARGKLRQATAKLTKLQFKQRFQKDRITNEILDARSAIQAAGNQLLNARINVENSAAMVRFEQRKFDLGRSDLLRVQIQEAKLADAQIDEVNAQLGMRLAAVNYRAAMGFDTPQ